MAPGFVGTDGMDWPKIKSPILNLNDDLSGPLVVLAGIVISMWTNCTFVSCVYTLPYFDGVVIYAVLVGFQTHFILSYSFTVFLIQGFAKKKANLLKPYLILKGVEMLLLFIGIIVQCLSWRPNPAIIPVAVIILLIASYIENMMYLSWKYIKDNPNPPKPTAVGIERVMIDKPPNYDNFTNQSVM